MRGLNATAVGAGPAHALYFACYEKLKKTLSDVIHPGANSHLANGTIKHAYTHINREIYHLWADLYFEISMYHCDRCDAADST